MYSLKLFDEVLIQFNMENAPTLKIRDIQVVSDKKNLFPEVLKKEVCAETIKKFLKKRIIPKNRAFVKNILLSQGLDARDIKGVIDVSKGLSLTDSYWVVKDEEMKFISYNLFDNEFSKELETVAFTGKVSKIKGIASSPEFSTDGMLPKAWRRIDDKVYLYKGSTDQTLKGSNTGNEPYSEFYASQLEAKMGISHVEYDLKMWKGFLASKCPIFTSKDVSFVPIYLATDANDIDEVHSWCKEKGYEEQFADMIVFDALTFNGDRHLGNFGVMKDNKTGEYIQFAPLFDNGAGLLSLAPSSAIENKKAFADYWHNDQYIQVSNYGVPYEKLVKYYCGKHQASKLRKLTNFRFQKHPKYNLPDERLEMLNSMIQERAIMLINAIESK